MKIGISGHQKRTGADWQWVRGSMREWLTTANIESLVGLTSLAQGADQIFAETILEQRGQIVAIIPHTEYIKSFTDECSAENFQTLLSTSKIVQLPDRKNREESYLRAGRYIVENSDLMFIVWDQRNAVGTGGTGDIAAYARDRGSRTVIFDPIQKTIQED